MTKTKNYWLVKSEPGAYSFEQLMKDKKTSWDGIRNYAARNNVVAMKTGDLVLFYHSNVGLSVVGIARVVKESYNDPTIADDRWKSVELEAVKPLNTPVSLEVMKKQPALEKLQLIKNSRLSVMPVSESEYQKILELGNTK